MMGFLTAMQFCNASYFQTRTCNMGTYDISTTGRLQHGMVEVLSNVAAQVVSIYKVARGSGALSAGRQQAGMMKDE
jgi:hypothetical protein